MAGFVYLITSKKQGKEYFVFKVGSSKSPKKRLSQLQTGCPSPLKIADLFFFSNDEDYKDAEKIFHSNLISFHSSGEWFRVPRSRVRDGYLKLVLDFFKENRVSRGEVKNVLV